MAMITMMVSTTSTLDACENDLCGYTFGRRCLLWNILVDGQQRIARRILLPRSSHLLFPLLFALLLASEAALAVSHSTFKILRFTI